MDAGCTRPVVILIDGAGNRCGARIRLVIGGDYARHLRGGLLRLAAFGSAAAGPMFFVSGRRGRIASSEICSARNPYRAFGSLVVLDAPVVLPAIRAPIGQPAARGSGGICLRYRTLTGAPLHTITFTLSKV